MEAGRPIRGSGRFALDGLDVVEIGRGRTDRRVASRHDRRLSLELPDAWMSQPHARLLRDGDAWRLEDLGSRNGSLVNDAAPTTRPLDDGAIIELGGTLFTFRAGLPAVDPADVWIGDGPVDVRLGTVVPAFAARLEDLARVARSAVSILVRGATGSGKEVLARSLHMWSGRSGPFVAVNCGAIPANLVESELFGYKKGAFSGAVEDKIGLVTAAAGGTLFLDEIGDLPLAAQPALLRVLQERAVMPVGAVKATPVDLRVIAATHRDLEAMVKSGEFREDLWSRLNGLVVELPRLADRREDLATLVATIAHRLGRSVTLSADAARAIFDHNWPREVRELEKAIESAIALAGGEEIDLVHLPPALGEPVRTSAPAIDDNDPRRAALVEALRAHQGNVSAAARAIGRPRTQVQRWMKKWGLKE
jgi:transcriptional regulator with PAS, ATPase and Fis domain